MEDKGFMKKFGMLLICVCLLVGCHFKTSQSTSMQSYQEPQNRTVYKYQDFLLFIYKENQEDSGFSFQFELNEVGIGDYAKYIDNSYHQATCSLSMQKDCVLTFTFEKDVVIVEATEEDDFLGADLSGHYVLGSVK